MPSRLQAEASFQEHQLQKMNNYILSQIGSADETPVYFDMPSNHTVQYISTKYMLNGTLGNVKMYPSFCAVLS